MYTPLASFSTVTLYGFGNAGGCRFAGTATPSGQTFGVTFGKLPPYALWPVLKFANWKLSSHPWWECQLVGHLTLPNCCWLVDSCSMLKSPSAGSFTITWRRWI